MANTKSAQKAMRQSERRAIRNRGARSAVRTYVKTATEAVANAVDNAAEVVAKGEMPPARYSIVHPEAQLSAREEQVLMAAMTTMGGQERGRSAEARGGDGRGRNRGP